MKPSFKIFRTSKPSETYSLGLHIGEKINSPQIICLIGPLGAGKTVFAKGLIRGIGVKSIVKSPSFVLVREYQGRLPVFHFDLYRIKGTEAMEDLGYREYFYSDAVTLIEWADSIRSLWPERYLLVDIGFVRENVRSIRLESRL